MDLFHRRSSSPRLPVDPLVASNIYLVPECVSETVHKHTFPDPASHPPQPFKLQREFSKAIDDDKLTSLGLGQEDAIRSKSCGARGAGRMPARNSASDA